MSRLLLVDDQQDIRLLVRTVLQRAKWEVEEADSGDSALEIWRAGKDRFALAVVDYSMPGLSGIELARIMHREGDAPPIILHSAYLTPEVETQASEMGLITVPKGNIFELRDAVRMHEAPTS